MGRPRSAARWQSVLAVDFLLFGEAIGAQAIWQVIEASNQLRGRCGERQVPNAKVAMAQTYGLMENSGTTILKI